ncbi:flagellar associated protein : flagellar associated protein [Nannochloropsis oceanica]
MISAPAAAAASMAVSSTATKASPLILEGMMGFNGRVHNGLHYTPQGTHTVYPLGSMVIVQNLITDQQCFLQGHTGISVSALAISQDGRRLATGEQGVTPGSKAEICVWDLEGAQALAGDVPSSPDDETKNRLHTDRLIIFRLRQHLGKVQALDFSCDGSYLGSVGGQDDNTVIVWDLRDLRPVPAQQEARRSSSSSTTMPSMCAWSRVVCAARGSDDMTLCLQWLHGRNDRFVTGGYFSLRVWQVDVETPKMHYMEAAMGTLRRQYSCLAISPNDKLCYCGTHTGDLVRVRIDRDPIPCSYNEPDMVRPILDVVSIIKFQRGIKALACFTNPGTGNMNVLVGAGDGKVAVMAPGTLKVVAGKSAQLLGGVTSLAVAPDGAGFLAATDQSNRFYLTFRDFVPGLRGTCHYAPINRLVFPAHCSELILTCSMNDIRVWNVALRQELLRIQVPNLEAKTVAITPKGSTILSGWSDGKVRAFYPESGKLKFVISNAHTEGAVTALAVCHDADEASPPWRVVTGGEDGRVRLWHMASAQQTMAFSAKDHRAAVTSLNITRDNRQCVSASADGSCIVWNLLAQTRLVAVFEPTLYEAALFHPDNSQLLTCGTNHHITYYNAYDGSSIRVLEGGEDAVVALDIVAGGEVFVSGGADKLVKVWAYDEGVVLRTGHGHSGPVQDVKVSPDERRVVSVGKEGGIFIWRLAGNAGTEVAISGAV